MRIVLHIDMDAFFAAVEERDKPRLKGLPIVVGSDPKDGKGRGVVATSNYKAREYGIRSAMPISEAWRRSERAASEGKPRVVFILGRHRRYSEVSEKIMEILRSFGGTLEQASIDEAYLEFKNDNWKHAEKIAKEIKEKISEQEKLTCSIGVGPNKLIAKIASGFKKPNGLTIIHPEDVQNFLDPMPVREIPGIGPKSGDELKKMGVNTIRELRAVPSEVLIEKFGKWGLGMNFRARGIDESPVVEEYETKSIGEQETYDEDSLNATFLLSRIKELSRAVAATAERKNFAFRTISISVRFENFITRSRSATLKAPSEGAKVVEGTALKLFLPFLDKRENPMKRKIRLLGVRVEKLSPVQAKLL